MKKRNVYIDVENTLTVPFVSGIQRVTLELTGVLTTLNHPIWQFVPVSYCTLCSGWIRHFTLESTVTGSSLRSRRQSVAKYLTRRLGGLGVDSLKRTCKKLIHPKKLHYQRLLPMFEKGSVFLDMDSSWHNQLKRESLLPALKKSGVNIVTLHHDAIPILMPELTHPNTVKVFAEHLSAHLKNSSLFLCNSKSTEMDLMKYVKASYPGVSIKTGTIRFGDLNNRKIHSFPNLIPNTINRYVLYVATIEPRKNHVVILDAFDRLAGTYPDLALVLVGRNGWNAERTTDRIRNHSLLDTRLFWFSNLPDEQLSSLYGNAFLCVSSSLYEGFGLPITEGLSHGCVTICSDSGALQEAAGEYADYFNPTDSKQLSKRIERYLKDGNLHKRRRRALLDREHRSWLLTAEELTTAINEHFR